ncbi:Protocadherin-1 [Echinococcus granulosus]|uniref:Protocadherin-1 n=1 Tax=Echinococcus granulosus TaxID=6210 RepID=W6UD97_ECHGR|nr:Protocadherin-1 [Echinococcus granulosus]EUB58963.1 Protocadherin-1 [Echinococcus granulosus]
MDCLVAWILLSLLHHLNLATELTFRLEEEVSSGKVVATNSDLASLLLNPDALPVIINRKSPGASSFSFVKRAQSGLELVVSGRVDREAICPTKGVVSGGLQHDTSTRPIFHIEDPGRILPFRSTFHDYDAISSNSPPSDCIVSLRVASSDKIFNIKIEIMDVNDNAPSWNSSTLHLSLRDGDPVGTVLYLPLAEDEDVGLNGEITYSLQAVDDDLNGGLSGGHRQSGSQLGWFELIKHSESPAAQRIPGVLLPHQASDQKLALRTKTLIDREQLQEIIRLNLVARDAGTPTPQQSSLKLVINVTDVNDNAPMFERPVYKVDILSEDAPVGRTLLQLHAKDMDSGPNAELTYRFESNGQPMLEVIRHFFEITPSGQLKILRRLNVDKIDGEQNLPSSTLIAFGVEAVDGASPPYALTGRTTIQLQISDTNDEAPRIQVYPVHPPKERPAGSANTVETTAQESGSSEQLLALVEVIDPDMDGLDTVECHLKGSVPDYFQLTSTPSTSGKGEYSLMTNARLDRETTPRLEVSIVCRDSAGHVSKQDVGINPIDVNDNAPKFDKPFYEFFIEENDGEAEVDDAIFPLNDKRPVRGQDGESGVHAWDVDAGENSRISYHLEPDPRDQSSVSYFSIDQNTGALFAVVPLDREAKSWHKFIAVASDHGDPTLSTNVEVLVHVENLNDNVPQFINQLVPEAGYSFSLDENESPGRFVGQITAVDADDEETMDGNEAFSWPHLGNFRALGSRSGQASTNRLIYTLGSEPDAAVFRIDKYSGNITTRERLDREKQSTYTFRVFVSDGFLPEASVEASLNQRWTPPKSRVHTVATSVVVNLRDQNDNRPTFLQPNATSHLILLDPTATPGRSLMQIIATDPDEGENGKVTYSIVDGNAGGIFFVAPVEGLLYLNGQIPRRTIEKAIYASASAAATASTTNSGMKKDESRGGWHSDVAGAGLIKEDSSEVPAHPTYVLKLEACDAGTPKQCSYFPNLQIQEVLLAFHLSIFFLNSEEDQEILTRSCHEAKLRVASEHSGGANGGASGGAGLPPVGYADHLDVFGGSDKDRRLGWGRNSLVEQVIIGLTVFFAVVVLVALLIVFLMRGGGGSAGAFASCSICISRKGNKTTEKIKQAPIGGQLGESEIPRSVPCRSEEYLSSASSGRLEGHFVDPHQGARILPAIPFSPVPQAMIDCSPYRDGYQLGNEILYPHSQSIQQSTSYGILGPTSLINSRPVVGPIQQQAHCGQDDYQCLDPAASRGKIIPTTSCEAYYQTNHPAGVWDLRYQSSVTTSWPRNQNTHPGLSHYAAGTTTTAATEGEGGDCGSGSLELMKNPFPDDDVERNEGLPTPPLALLTTTTSNTSAASRSRTLIFPKATFV